MRASTALWPTTVALFFLLNAVPSSSAQTVSGVAYLGSAGCDTWYTVVAQGRDGNLYTTLQQCGADDMGGVVKVTPEGEVTALYAFDGTDGSGPEGGLTLGTDGNFYGTTFGGGSDNAGTIFKISSAGALTVLYNFPGGTLGEFPLAAPIEASDGNFYGTTWYGGPSYICGTVYKMTPSGAVTILHGFNFADGCAPFAPLTQGSDGWLYGTTVGAEYPYQYELGNIFKIDPKTGDLTVLYSFDGTHGSRPTAPVIEGTDGNWYGVASGGGTALGRAYYHGGTLFQLTPGGTLTVLHNFNPDASAGDAYDPYGGLIQATNDVFYSTGSGGGVENAGAMFSLDLSDDYSVFYSFSTGSPAGYLPVSTMMQHTNGNLYGLATGGDALYSLSENLSPFAALVPASGAVGATIGILGQGFTVTDSVTFNGLPASFTVVSDTYLTAVVPSGATSGPVVVTTHSATLTSNRNFTVTR